MQALMLQHAEVDASELPAALDYFPHGATARAMPMATTTRPVTAVKAPITCRVRGDAFRHEEDDDNK